ncbi:hypothetical protein Ancab_011510 [Ancistrocladus abbreviatus]
MGRCSLSRGVRVRRRKSSYGSSGGQLCFKFCSGSRGFYGLVSGGPTDNVGFQGGMNPVACTDTVGLAHNHMASNSLPGSGVRGKFKRGHLNRNLRMGRLSRAEGLLEAQASQ